MHRHRRDLEPQSEMNLTNLIDTSFILLIAFLLVAPTIKHGIDLELPHVTSQTIETQSKTVTIAVRKRPMEGVEDPIYIEDKRVTIDELGKIVEDKRAKYPKLDILIEADKGTTYDTIAKILARLMELGVENIGLITEPRETKS